MKQMLNIKDDVTDKYYDMLNSFNADNILKEEGKYFDKEKELFKNKDERLMKDIELLKELEFNLRHEFMKIVEIDRDSLWNLWKR